MCVFLGDCRLHFHMLYYCDSRIDSRFNNNISNANVDMISMKSEGCCGFCINFSII